MRVSSGDVSMLERTYCREPISAIAHRATGDGIAAMTQSRAEPIAARQELKTAID